MRDILKPFIITVCALLILAFITNYYNSQKPKKSIDESIIVNTRTIQRNGYNVYCFKHKIRVRYMDSVYYTFDSIKIVEPPKDFYPEY